MVKNQRLQFLSAQEIEVFGIVVRVLRDLLNTLAPIENRKVGSYKFVRDQVNLLAESFPRTWQISNQELNDIQLELRRLRFLVRESFCNAM